MKSPTLAISTPARRRWTPRAEQTRWVKAWEGSGQTQRQFARAHALSVGTLRNWIGRHRAKEIDPRSEPELREVDLGELIGPEIAGGTTRWEAEIRLPSGVSLAVSRGTSTERVRELLEALRC